MKTKSRNGGRPKPPHASTSNSTPSMASPVVTIRDAPNAEDNTMKETPTKETHVVLDDDDCFCKDTCIRCDESGKLLVCSEIGCPIAVHEHCTPCESTFDEEGHFYCPYCSYKRALALVNETRRKAMAAKRALSEFIDTGVVGGDNSQQTEVADKDKSSDISARGVDTNPSNEESSPGSLQDQAVMGDQNQEVPAVTPEIRILGNSMNREEACEASTSGRHHVEDLEDGKMMEEGNLRSMGQIQNEGAVKNQGLETLSTHNANADADDKSDAEVEANADADAEEDDIDYTTEEEENVTSSKETAGKGGGGEQMQPGKDRLLVDTNVESVNNKLDKQPAMKKLRFKSIARKRKRPQTTDSPRKSLHVQKNQHEKKHMTNIEKVSPPRDLKKQQESTYKFKNLDFLNGKRKRLHWSTEEEEMLKEGVHKFSSKANKNIPWRKILEFGSHIFDATRAPADLKDKWRNIVARESSTKG